MSAGQEPFLFLTKPRNVEYFGKDDPHYQHYVVARRDISPPTGMAFRYTNDAGVSAPAYPPTLPSMQHQRNDGSHSHSRQGQGNSETSGNMDGSDRGYMGGLGFSRGPSESLSGSNDHQQQNYENRSSSSMGLGSMSSFAAASTSVEDNNGNNGHSDNFDKQVEQGQGRQEQQSSSPGFGSGLYAKMLKKSGWTEGKGLGKNESGISSAIAADDRGGRTGLGFSKESSSPDDEGDKARNPFAIPLRRGVRHDIDINAEPRIDFDVVWEDSQRENFDKNVVEQWVVKTETVPMRLEDRPAIGNGCDENLVTKLNACKSYLDHWSQGEFLDARTRSNPYEKIGKFIFQNRAALKMAEMDAKFRFTELAFANRPKLLFADICAGPGGFTEYMMWRKKDTRAQGWGFTLAGDYDFKLHKFNRDSPCSNFKLCYGADGTGNILLTENIRHFTNVIDQATNGVGLDLVTADGGISVDGVENYQELLTKQLVLGQFLTAMCILRKGGSFMCKIFDTFSPFLETLLALLASEFEEFSIVKPITSRPANSEKYVVGTGFLRRSPPTCEHLFRVNDALNAAREYNERVKAEAVGASDGVDKLSYKDQFAHDILYAAPPEIVTGKFRAYLKDVNTRIIHVQIDSLLLLHKYLEDPELPSLNQPAIAKKCLESWGLPYDLLQRMRAPRANIQQEEHRRFRNEQVQKNSANFDAEQARRRAERMTEEKRREVDRIIKEREEREAELKRERERKEGKGRPRDGDGDRDRSRDRDRDGHRHSSHHRSSNSSRSSSDRDHRDHRDYHGSSRRGGGHHHHSSRSRHEKRKREHGDSERSAKRIAIPSQKADDLRAAYNRPVKLPGGRTIGSNSNNGAGGGAGKSSGTIKISLNDPKTKAAIEAHKKKK